VLLHGLTFDRSLWQPALTEFRRLDPHRRVLVLDLPGHGDSAGWLSYDMVSVADAVHLAVEQAGLSTPILVGHSISAIVATVYATRYDTKGVINVDQPLQIGPFAGLVKSLADKLRGPAFPAVWEMFAANMGVDLLPESAKTLVLAASRPRQDLVLGYWREIFDLPVEDLIDTVDTGLKALNANEVPYLIVTGAEPEAAYRNWVTEQLPQARIITWSDSGHFPHLAHPDRFAAVLAQADW
jgi:pimeloyl-ACP methyl ester carboxylesterase